MLLEASSWALDDAGVLRLRWAFAAKQERIRKTAAFYLMEKGLDCPVRFDVAEVYTDGAHSPAATHIEYIEHAF